MSAVCRPFAAVVWQEVERRRIHLPHVVWFARKSKHTSQGNKWHSILKTAHNITCHAARFDHWLENIRTSSNVSPGHCYYSVKTLLVHRCLWVHNAESVTQVKGLVAELNLNHQRGGQESALKTIPGSLSQQNHGSCHDDADASRVHQV